MFSGDGAPARGMLDMPRRPQGTHCTQPQTEEARAIFWLFCSFCSLYVQEGETVRVLQQCGHVFHKS